MSIKGSKKYCVVGVGKHAVNRIIPALLAGKNDISGIVTSNKKNSVMLPYRSFTSIDEAIINLSENTIFILTTPPNIHNLQIKKILKYGRDIIVEKPGFVEEKDVKQVMKLDNFFKNVIFEAFMYKHTKLYKKFISFWKQNHKDIVCLKSNFYIPEMPPNTFREKNDIKSSCLYDMGCYALSLLTSLDLSLQSLKITEVNVINGRLNDIKIVGRSKNIDFELNFGISKIYENSIVLFRYKDHIEFNPFFLGVKKNKFLNYYSDNNIDTEEFQDLNGFEEMFKLDRDELMSNQENRFKSMLKVTKKLNILEKQLIQKLK